MSLSDVNGGVERFLSPLEGRHQNRVVPDKLLGGEGRRAGLYPPPNLCDTLAAEGLRRVLMLHKHVGTSAYWFVGRGTRSKVVSLLSSPVVPASA